jgi:RNA polymerase sigma-70 factor (ECF subfamily)
MNPISDFDDIYRENTTAVYRVCLRAVSQRAIAEELTSEVFLALHESWTRILPEQLPAWLFTVARRRAADYWRRRYVEERRSDSQGNQNTWSEPEHPLADLLVLCDTLKPVHRICLTLRFAHGMPRTEIASATNLSELQVKGHLQYALQLLRPFIQPGTSAEPISGGLSQVELDA